MSPRSADDRSARRKLEDERLADEPPLAPPTLTDDATTFPVESLLKPRRHPVAVEGVVENGLVRPLDPAVKLTEQSRVIIVASQ